MLPKWMQQAVKEQVLSPQEAQEMHQVALSSSTEYVNLPEHLHPAAERVHLWEQQSLNRLPI
jgi:hypothetical protein